MLRRTSDLHVKTMHTRLDDSKEAFDGWIRTRALFMLGINYRWSDIVYDERTKLDKVKDEALMKASSYGGYTEQIICAGDRAPDAPVIQDNGSETTLFKLFNPAKHAVLIFVSDNQAVEEERVQEVLKALDGYPKDTIQTILVSSNEKIKVVGVDYTVIDRDRHAASSYLTENEKVMVVIRPDTYVGAVVKGAEGLKNYFSTIFN